MLKVHLLIHLGMPFFLFLFVCRWYFHTHYREHTHIYQHTNITGKHTQRTKWYVEKTQWLSIDCLCVCLCCCVIYHINISSCGVNFCVCNGGYVWIFGGVDECIGVCVCEYVRVLFEDACVCSWMLFVDVWSLRKHYVTNTIHK